MSGDTNKYIIRFENNGHLTAYKIDGDTTKLLCKYNTSMHPWSLNDLVLLTRYLILACFKQEMWIFKFNPKKPSLTLLRTEINYHGQWRFVHKNYHNNNVVNNTLMFDRYYNNLIDLETLKSFPIDHEIYFPKQSIISQIGIRSFDPYSFFHHACYMNSIFHTVEKTPRFDDIYYSEKLKPVAIFTDKKNIATFLCCCIYKARIYSAIYTNFAGIYENLTPLLYGTSMYDTGQISDDYIFHCNRSYEIFQNKSMEI